MGEGDASEPRDERDHVLVGQGPNGAPGDEHRVEGRAERREHGHPREKEKTTSTV